MLEYMYNCMCVCVWCLKGSRGNSHRQNWNSGLCRRHHHSRRRLSKTSRICFSVPDEWWCDRKLVFHLVHPSGYTPLWLSLSSRILPWCSLFHSLLTGLNIRTRALLVAWRLCCGDGAFRAAQCVDGNLIWKVLSWWFYSVRARIWAKAVWSGCWWLAKCLGRWVGNIMPNFSCSKIDLIDIRCCLVA